MRAKDLNGSKQYFKYLIYLTKHFMLIITHNYSVLNDLKFQSNHYFCAVTEQFVGIRGGGKGVASSY